MAKYSKKDQKKVEKVKIRQLCALLALGVVVHSNAMHNKKCKITKTWTNKHGTFISQACPVGSTPQVPNGSYPVATNTMPVGGPQAPEKVITIYKGPFNK